MFDRIGATKRSAQSRAMGLAAALFIHSLIVAVALSMRQAPPPIEVVPLGPEIIRPPHGAPGQAHPGPKNDVRRDVAPQHPRRRLQSPPKAIPSEATHLPPLIESSPEPEPGPGAAEAGEPGEGAATPGCIGGFCGGPGPSASPPEEIVEINPDMRYPAPLCDPAQPAMPEQARMMDIGGRVVVRYV